MLVLSARSGALAARIGPRLQMSAGPIVIAAGLLLLMRATGHGGYLADVLPAVLVFGAGLAINVAPLTSTAMSAVPAEHAGIASAVNNDVARAAGLIAVAVLPVAAGITGDSYLHPAELSRGFQNALLIAAISDSAQPTPGRMSRGAIHTRTPLRSRTLQAASAAALSFDE